MISEDFLPVDLIQISGGKHRVNHRYREPLDSIRPRAFSTYQTLQPPFSCPKPLGAGAISDRETTKTPEYQFVGPENGLSPSRARREGVGEEK